MSLIVADTTPLNYLVLIGREAVLQRLYSQVIIPAAVHRELLDSRAPDSVRGWASVLPEWAVVRESEHLLQLPTLDPGEVEAITIAEALGATVLLDEKKARAIAERRGVVVIGTLGVLRIAANQQLLDFEESIRKLKATNVRLSEDLLERIRRGVFGPDHAK